ncbi:MAG: tRNA (adenosine(37)-N6)-threonylcarbamoyltransferase complex ATPase subunit type 1 TsaE [Arenicellales bacterium]|jgi:tRNA threonylcarbamoyladenosine biosynthesis protein TsaE|nr:tRNA (adenosine(37)-N6)-threonylcarbamoyltransferase complex ATPase subunit type 1 TsaE [Arenicellales bacterium]MDP6855045.1 tRNA (adenosine(37)-N6)-threonylcarbamoyltransferase complex ATPase subunit type 1 TsaE [Arenicellales bacterium]MDP6949271.1 tRNA (adenosine(37)-N6)-threonylcarbamoyltransferase complex ATPase subunit type 1 TsaE [Arenicellales bacterium]|tara:strand:+ start:93 stop:545 length:453 start_codon:yes stop_codon:yes gene_type:complete
MNHLIAAPDEASLRALGRAFAAVLAPGDVIYLEGELGAGKTVFVRGILAGMGYSGVVVSPTYTLAEEYPTAAGPVVHYDLYRLQAPHELELLGMREHADGRRICLIEWPGRGQGHLPEATWVVTLRYADKGRAITFTGQRPLPQSLVGDT